jgi:hypothetical protein
VDLRKIMKDRNIKQVTSGSRRINEKSKEGEYG